MRSHVKITDRFWSFRTPSAARHCSGGCYVLGMSLTLERASKRWHALCIRCLESRDAARTRMLVPILRIRRCPLVVRSVRARFLLSYLQLRAYGSCTRACMHEQSALLGFNCDPWRSLIPLFSPSLSVFVTGYRAAQLGRIGSFVSHMNVHAHPYVTCPHTAAISAFLPSVVARSRCECMHASTANKDYVSQIGISRRLASTERQRQVRTRHFAGSVSKCSQHTRCDCTVVSSNAIPWQAICFVRK